MATPSTFSDPTLADGGRIFHLTWLDTVSEDQRARMAPRGVDPVGGGWLMIGTRLARWAERLMSQGLTQTLSELVLIREWNCINDVVDELGKVIGAPAFSPAVEAGRTWAATIRPEFGRAAISFSFGTREPGEFGSPITLHPLLLDRNSAAVAIVCDKLALLVDAHHCALTVCAARSGSSERTPVDMLAWLCESAKGGYAKWVGLLDRRKASAGDHFLEARAKRLAEILGIKGTVCPVQTLAELLEHRGGALVVLDCERPSAIH